MRTNETKPEPVKPPQVANATTTWPTVEQLTSVAASLATRPNAGEFKPEQIASDAFDLWVACGNQIRERWDFKMTVRSAPPLPEPLPEPKSFPVTLDDFLKFALPEKRNSDRLTIYKAHLMAFGRTKSEAERLIATKRKRMFNERQFGVAREFLRNWLPGYEAKNRTLRASSGGKAKALKQ